MKTLQNSYFFKSSRFGTITAGNSMNFVSPPIFHIADMCFALCEDVDGPADELPDEADQEDRSCCIFKL